MSKYVHKSELTNLHSKLAEAMRQVRIYREALENIRGPWLSPRTAGELVEIAKTALESVDHDG